MNQEKKRKLRNIALLAILGLVGGTFAFTAFNQQAINDREVENRARVGGRVHDYFNRDTENKDVFVENFGQEPILVRLQLSEFLEIQERGNSVWEQLTPGSRENLNSWTPYIPHPDNVSLRSIYSNNSWPEAAEVLNNVSNLTFGYEDGAVSPPWYLPTFNTVNNSYITAAAGHARDLSYERDGEVYQRATHPGTGEANYWSQGESYTNTGQWPGQTITRETAQNMYQDRAPITLSQWEERYLAYQNGQSDGEDLIGNYWVMDEADGWAYYAIALQAGDATSYLLDASHMTDEAHEFPGSYYYGIHVKSELIGTPPPAGNGQGSDIPRFYDEPANVGFGGVLGNFLELVRGTAFDGPNVDLPDDKLDDYLDQASPGSRFTVDDEQFLYLGEVGTNEHMIITVRTLKALTWNEQPTALAAWYADRGDDLKARVQPVAIPARDAVPGTVLAQEIDWGAYEAWVPTNNMGPAAQDLTRVNPQGSPQAFALSLADVVHFSATTPNGHQPNIAFPTFRSRVAGDGEWWFTRTPERGEGVHPGPMAWGIDNEVGQMDFRAGAVVPGPRGLAGTTGGVRLALIIRGGSS